jgi:hypothetical protein
LQLLGFNDTNKRLSDTTVARSCCVQHPLTFRGTLQPTSDLRIAHAAHALLFDSLAAELGRQEEEMKLDWEMQAGRRLCGSVRAGPATVVRFAGKLAP